MCNISLKHPDEKPKIPIKGMSIETFVWHYIGNSQMNINTINGIDISGWGAEIMWDIWETVRNHK